jgi:hypothetical protein
MNETPPPPSRAKLLRATLVALALAAVLLVTVVLPAEYDIDPLGTGRLLGLVVLGGEAPLPADEIPISEGLTADSSSYRTDTQTFFIPPSSFVEYKYRLEAGRAMVYTWAATDRVRSEMHSEPHSAPGTAEFFEVVDSTLARHGSYVAPFSGIHGWYWLNSGADTVRLTIHTAGHYTWSTEFRPSPPPIERDMRQTPLGELRPF